MSFYFKKHVFLYFSNPHLRICLLALQGGREGERKDTRTHREKHQSEGETSMGPGANHSLGMCPDQGRNGLPFDVRDDAPTS